MSYRRITVLTGAGISAESGMGTFRDKDGLWTKYPLEDVATPEGFARNPTFVHDFYNARRRGLIDAKANPAHTALAHLEAHIDQQGGEVLTVTQNVDNLHELGGSKRIIHMHGELRKIRCEACGSVRLWETDLSVDETCPACGVTGGLRPHVVWFGEMPLQMDEIYQALLASDLFVSIGTSGNVYPAAGFVDEARSVGIRTVELNLEPSENAYAFDDALYGPASEIVPRWVESLISGEG